MAHGGAFHGNARADVERQRAQLRKGNIGFVFQSYHLLPEFDALENVLLPARMAHANRAESLRRAESLMDRVGLAKRMNHLPAELSGGEQQRVALARALINQPKLLLADEPTGNLDSKTGNEVLDLLCEIQAENKLTMIIATHDDKVAKRARRTVQLVDGLIAT